MVFPKPDVFQKLNKGRKFAVEGYQMILFLHNGFSIIIRRLFRPRIKIFRTWKKVENVTKEEGILGIPKEKRFPLFKGRLHQNGKAENMPVVASRFVKLITKWAANYCFLIGLHLSAN